MKWMNKMWQVSLTGITLATSIYSCIQEELDSMPKMHPTVIIPIYKEFNKSFKLKYYIYRVLSSSLYGLWL